MIGQISHIETIESLTNYHFKKMEEGVAVLLDSSKVDIQCKQMANLSFKSQSLIAPDYRTPYTHISLNFAIEDTEFLSDQLMTTITKEFIDNLQYLDQPYMIVRHNDQEHPHAHIITTDVKDNGTKINKHNEYFRIKTICRELEEKYNLRIVPNVKIDKDESIHIVNESDYKNYLQIAVRDTLRLKPKRFSDFQTVLKEVYHIDTFKTSTKSGKKGVSFALVDSTGSRYLEDKGTLAIAGSTLSNKYSFNKLTEVIESNYKSAPSRYKYMLNYQNKINEDLFYFDKIRFSDFQHFNPKHKLVIENDKPTLIIDLKGNNVFRTSELKVIDSSKISSEETNVNLDKSDENNVSLRTKIYSEAIDKYSNDISKGMKTSYFITNVMDFSTISDYLADSKTLDHYSNYFSQEQLTDLFDLKKLNIDEYYDLFQSRELQSEAVLFGAICEFSEVNESNIELNKLFVSKERKDFIGTSLGQFCGQFFNYQFKLHNTDKTKELPYHFSQVNFNQLFLFNQYFEIEQLNSLLYQDFSSFANERLFKSFIENKTKENISSQEFIQFFNQRGFQFSLNEKGNVQVCFNNLKSFSYSKLNDYLKEDLLSTTLNQNVEHSLASIELRINIDTKNWSRVEQLIEFGTIEEQFLILDNPDYSAYLENKSMIKDINAELYQIKNQLNLDYFSELIPVIRDFKSDFVNQIGEQIKTSGKPFNYSILENHLNELISEPSLINLQTEEKQKINTFLSKITQFKDSSTLFALTGFYNTNSGLTERNGVYHFRYKANQKLLDFFNNDNTFGFESIQFRSLINNYFSNVDSPLFIPILEKYKDWLNIDDYTKLSEFTHKSYLNYYINELKGLTVEDRLDFLSSKGIIVQKISDSDFSFKLIHSDTKLILNESDFPKFSQNLDKQSKVFHEYNYTNKESFLAHLRFHNHLENGDYLSAAFELKKSKISPFLSEADSIMHSDNLEEKLNELSSKNQPNYLPDLIDLFQALQNNKSQQKDQHGKNNDKKKKRNKGRNF